MKRILIFIAVCLVAGCAERPPQDTNVDLATSGTHDVITAEFLVERGFSESEGGSGIFSLLDVRLGDASRNLGFALSDLRLTPSQPRFSDVRTLQIKNLNFVVQARIRTVDGKQVVDSLDDPDAICTLSVALQQVPPDREMTKKGQSPNL